mmetsp:Transcript_88105/g.169574  ORF Transcript_88105/g.169574 Transcript_88105/m.169574 type:complete len:261 (-) Transcript_88105:721-1503(-)
MTTPSEWISFRSPFWKRTDVRPSAHMTFLRPLANSTSRRPSTKSRSVRPSNLRTSRTSCVGETGTASPSSATAAAVASAAVALARTPAIPAGMSFARCCWLVHKADAPRLRLESLDAAEAASPTSTSMPPKAGAELRRTAGCESVPLVLCGRATDARAPREGAVAAEAVGGVGRMRVGVVSVGRLRMGVVSFPSIRAEPFGVLEDVFCGGWRPREATAEALRRESCCQELLCCVWWACWLARCTSSVSSWFLRFSSPICL